MKKVVKVTFTLAAGVYGKNIVEPILIEDSKEFAVFTVGSIRTRVFKEGFGILIKSDVISDNKPLIFQRVAWCEPDQVESLEKEFLASAKKRYSELLVASENSLRSIQEREDQLDV